MSATQSQAWKKSRFGCPKEILSAKIAPPQAYHGVRKCAYAADGGRKRCCLDDRHGHRTDDAHRTAKLSSSASGRLDYRLILYYNGVRKTDNEGDPEQSTRKEKIRPQAPRESRKYLSHRISRPYMTGERIPSRYNAVKSCASSVYTQQTQKEAILNDADQNHFL